MNADDTALIFVVEYYEMYANGRDALANAYKEDARAILYFKDRQIKQTTQNQYKLVPDGIRNILACSGQIVGNDLFVHVKSTLTLPGSTDFVDEVFRCHLTDTSILITYHSIHVNPIVAVLPPLAPLPSPHTAPPNNDRQQNTKQEQPKKPRVPAVEVNSPSELNSKLSVLVENLSFSIAPSKFLPLLEQFGQVLKFCQTGGKIVAEYESFPDMKSALSTKFENWNGRVPRIKRMPQDYTF